MNKLAIAQIVVGILVVGSLIYWIGWLSTGYLYAEGTVPGTDIHVGVFSNPGRATLFCKTWPLLYFTQGLAVLGCGISQYFKARRQSAVKGNKPESGDENTVVKV